MLFWLKRASDCPLVGRSVRFFLFLMIFLAYFGPFPLVLGPHAQAVSMAL